MRRTFTEFRLKRKFAICSPKFANFAPISFAQYCSTNFSTALRLRNCHFLSFFYFFFVSFYRIFSTYFSLLSPVSLTLFPLAPDKRERPFVLLQTIRSTIRAFLAYAKVPAVLCSEKLCTDWPFSVIETLAVILNCRWQVKRLKVPFNGVWKENIVFSKKKTKQTNKQKQTR